MMRVEVEAYSGYKANERPLRFRLGTVTYEVKEVLDRWYGPDDEWFKVETENGDLYILRYRPGSDEWTLDSFRRSQNE
jgi:hypothetical protein